MLAVRSPTLKRRGEKENWQILKQNDIHNSTAIISRQNINKLDFYTSVLTAWSQTPIIWTR